MKSIIGLLVAWLALSPSFAHAADKYALLIGVTTYEHAQMNRSPLKYPEADAAAVAELLKSSGYEVKVLTGKQATQQAIESELSTLEKQGTQDGVVFIGLFGHGVQYGNDAYFGPYNTKLRKVMDFKGNTIVENGKPRLEPDPQSMTSMQRLLEALTACGAANRVLIADCCRDDPSAARGRAFGSNVKVSDLEPGTAAIFSCSNTEQAFEHDDWGHGAFTKAFLDYCNKLPGDDATANAMSNPLFRNVQSMVKEKTNGRSLQTVNPLVSGIVDLKLLVKPSTVVKADALTKSEMAAKSKSPERPMQKSNSPALSSGKNSKSSDSTSIGTEEIRNSTGMTLQAIKPGEFRMGSAPSDGNRGGDEYPMHRVGITKGFYMATTEVTQSQWVAVMESRPWQGQLDVQEGDDFPVTCVSWAEAVEFCQKLSEKEGATYRLPTEAEWEYACRASSDTAFSFEGSDRRLQQHAWFDFNTKSAGESYAHPVRMKSPNQFGLYDMHGNAAEWCQDTYSETAYADRAGSVSDRAANGRPAGGRTQPERAGKKGPGSSDPGNRRPVVADPLLQTDSDDRVVRGGSWTDREMHTRSASRGRVKLDQKLSTVGFRVVQQ